MNLTRLADMQPLLSALRELLDELNAHAAAGLITHRALVLLNRVEQMTRALEGR